MTHRPKITPMTLVFFLYLATSSALVATYFTPVDVADLINSINTANTNGQADVIDLSNGPFDLSSTYDTLDGNNGLPSILNDGHPIMVRDGKIRRTAGGHDFRLFRIDADAELILENVELENGLANVSGFGQAGGAVLNLGRLTLLSSKLYDNVGDFGGALYTGRDAYSNVFGSTFRGNFANNNGGAIYNEDLANIDISNTLIMENAACQNGGAIYNDGDAGGGVINAIKSTTFAYNHAGQSGGAIYNHDATIINILNSTFSGNIARDFSGGAISNLLGGLIDQVGNNTFTLNRAGDVGGAIDNNSSINNLFSNIIAQNSATNGNAELSTLAPIGSASYNLIGDDQGHGIVDGTDGNKVGTTGSPLDAMLLPLANNGGLTPTHALDATSLAIDMGDNPFGLFFDQRGPGFPRFSGPRPDIGSFELESAIEQFKPDHYISYDIKTTPFYPKTISLRDQFLGWTQFKLINPIKVLNPAVKRHNGIVYGINNEKLHYTAFRLWNDQEITVEKNVYVKNQFGEFYLNQFRPDHLLVPSHKIDFIPASIDDDYTVYNSDHYLCYDIEEQQINLERGFFKDQFRGRDFVIRKATKLCNPAAKLHDDHESDIIHDVPSNHLMCFRLQRRRIFKQIALLNQFGIQKAVTINDDEICVPSTKFNLN